MARSISKEITHANGSRSKCRPLPLDMSPSSQSSVSTELGLTQAPGTQTAGVEAYLGCGLRESLNSSFSLDRGCRNVFWGPDLGHTCSCKRLDRKTVLVEQLLETRLREEEKQKEKKNNICTTRVRVHSRWGGGSQKNYENTWESQLETINFWGEGMSQPASVPHRHEDVCTKHGGVVRQEVPGRDREHWAPWDGTWQGPAGEKT